MQGKLLPAACNHASYLFVLLQYFSVVNEGTAVKAYAKPEQNTIILRDIPSSVTIEAIYNIFATAVGSDGSPCPPIVTARLDLNNCW